MQFRNVILRIEVDSLLTLTIELNALQEIEKEKGIHNRPIEKVVLKEYGKDEEELISYFPFRKQVKYGALFDVYIKYTDIYQHLDKDLIYSQIPSAAIEEAG